MSCKRFLIVIIVLVVSVAVSAGAKQADLAGAWYASSPGALLMELESYLRQANVANIDGDIVGVVAPHAGFRYSGAIAAYSYKALMQKKPEKVVLVGFTHRRYYPGKISVFAENSFITPLGALEIDKSLTGEFLAYGRGLADIPEAFIQENSIELQIPFIQVALPETKVAIIAITDQSKITSRILSDALYEVLKDEENYAIIISTDMCHYLDYDNAVSRDKTTIDAIRGFDPDKFYAASQKEGHELMCGFGAVYGVMDACKRLGADSVEVLKYANSGDTSGMKDRVVGYVSAAFVDTNESEKVAPAAKGDESMFSDVQKKELLAIARDSIKHYLDTGEPPKLETQDPALKEEMGAFVTLHKDGRLRGCIGNMIGRGPLDITVRDMAIAAAFDDPRFSKLTSGEFDDIDIEVSVLSPMERIEDPETIEMGKHGVMVRSGWRTGVYLPQVATETGWSREQFMDSLCAQKAGLPSDAWKTGDCEIYVYTAEVFGEKDQL